METKGTFGAGPNSCCEGRLTPAQMELVLRSLPVQISVMDEQGTMVYWRGVPGPQTQPQPCLSASSSVLFPHSWTAITSTSSASRASQCLAMSFSQFHVPSLICALPSVGEVWRAALMPGRLCACAVSVP